MLRENFSNKFPDAIPDINGGMSNRSSIRRPCPDVLTHNIMRDELLSYNLTNSFKPYGSSLVD